MLIDKYKLIAFDLDGTLIHTTGEYRYAIVPKVLKRLGLKSKISLKLIDKFWFDAGRDQLILDNFNIDPKTFWKVFNKLDLQKERAKYTHCYDDVLEVLKVLKKRGKKLAITTGAPKKLASWEIELLPKDFFEKIISIHSSRYRAKPHPESLQGCLKFCEVKNNDAVYIGNGWEDIEYAYNAGVDSIFLERRPHTLKTKVKPNKIINTLTELLENE